MATDKKRLTVSLDREDEAAVEKYRHNNMLSSSSSAISELMRIGINKVTTDELADGGTIIVDARKNLMNELFDSLDDEDKAIIYKFGRFLRTNEKYNK